MPAKTLGGIVSKLPEGQISFKLNEKGTFRISYNQSFFNIHTLPADEFPVLPKIKEGKSFSVDPQVFSSMIRQTVFSASTSEDKYILNGVLLEAGKSSLTGDNSNLRMISTDGYRLAKRAEKVQLDKEAQLSAIVPSKALQELLRILEQAKEGEELKITVSSDQISFRYADIYLVSRLIQGQFPDYKQVIPKKSATRISIETEVFLESAERAAVIASGSANVVRFEVRIGQLHLFATTPDVGSIDEILEAEIKGGEKLQMAFNIRLITDVLRVIETEKVSLEFGEALGPGIIRQEGEGEFLYIVMPIRTQEAA